MLVPHVHIDTSIDNSHFLLINCILHFLVSGQLNGMCLASSFPTHKRHVLSFQSLLASKLPHTSKPTHFFFWSRIRYTLLYPISALSLGKIPLFLQKSISFLPSALHVLSSSSSYIIPVMTITIRVIYYIKKVWQVSLSRSYPTSTIPCTLR